MTKPSRYGHQFKLRIYLEILDILDYILVCDNLQQMGKQYIHNQIHT
jgi:hypothetical protein